MKKASLVPLAFAMLACSAPADRAECSDGMCATPHEENGVLEVAVRDAEGVDRGNLEWSSITGEGTWTPPNGRSGVVRADSLSTTQACKLATELAKRGTVVTKPRNGYATCSVDDNYEPCQDFTVYGASCTACLALESDCSSSMRVVCAQSN